MIHGNDVSFAQLILIEVGAMLQLAALWAFMKESAKPSGNVSGAGEAQDAHRDQREGHLPEADRPAAVVEYQREIHGEMEAVPAGIRPGDLLKTAKVAFKQSLRPRQGEKAHKPSARW